jgi:hypothetical protein
VFIEQLTEVMIRVLAAEVIVHPVVSPTEKPVPETLIVAGLAGALGGPAMGGEPLVGLTVARGRIPNVATPVTPVLPVR